MLTFSIHSEIVEICETQEVFLGDLWREKCKKYVHSDVYIDIDLFNLQYLEDEIKDVHLKDYILVRGKLVVKIKVREASPNRIKKSSNCRATGYAWCTDKQEIIIYTNKHVVFDDFEAEKTELTFSFDGKNFTAFGTKLRECRDNKDLVCLEVRTSDSELHKFIGDFTDEAANIWDDISVNVKEAFKKYAVVISHPHGLQKVVSIGKLISLEEEEEYLELTPGESSATDTDSRHPQQHLHKPLRKVTRYDAATCPGSSGAPVLTGFYPHRPFTHSSHNRELNLNFCMSY